MAGGVGGVQGSLAGFAVVDAALLARVPAKWSMREAAASPRVFITAWEGLVDRARVAAGRRVPVHGGAGGIGRVAIQIAASFGARVYATGLPRQTATIERLGAAFSDRSAAVEGYVQRHADGEGFDVVFDTVGGEVLDASFAAAAPYRGHAVSALGWGTHSLAPLSLRAATYSGVFTLRPLLTGQGRAHHGAILREAARLADAGRWLVRVDPRPFALAETEAAYRHLESGAAQGGLGRGGDVARQGVRGRAWPHAARCGRRRSRRRTPASRCRAWVASPSVP